MGSINRGNLPTNFLDHVSQAGLRLPTPEPRYVFARMAMAGRLSLAALRVGAPTVQQYVTVAGGGAELSPELAELVRFADAHPGAIQTVDNFGLGKGDTIKFDRDVYSGGGYTESARELTTDSTISTTGQTIQEEQIPVVLKEYTGAHDGSSVKPYAIWNFDAKYRANKESLASKTSRHLRRDYIKWLDTVLRDRFRKSQYVTHADGVTDVTAMTLGAGHIHSLETWLEARKTLTDREWQPFPNGRYIALVGTDFNTDMIGDVDYRELSKNHAAGRNLIFGYLGSVQDIDYYEVSNLKTFIAAAVVPNSGTVPTGAQVEESLLIGPGAVGMGTALSPEARYADDTNYGTVAKVIWYALHAFQTLDERGVQRVLTQSL